MSAAENPSAFLRRAASLMRERAQKATPGPWRAHDDQGDWYVSSVEWGQVTTGINEDPSVGDHVMIERDKADAEHIASWDPPMALAVADWLETEAHMVALRGNSSEGQTFHALKAARAYLGEPETEGAER